MSQVPHFKRVLYNVLKSKTLDQSSPNAVFGDYRKRDFGAIAEPADVYLPSTLGLGENPAVRLLPGTIVDDMFETDDQIVFQTGGEEYRIEEKQTISQYARRVSHNLLRRDGEEWVPTEGLAPSPPVEQEKEGGFFSCFLPK